jgi:hypothetical protein
MRPTWLRRKDVGAPGDITWVLRLWRCIGIAMVGATIQNVESRARVLDRALQREPEHHVPRTCWLVLPQLATLQDEIPLPEVDQPLQLQLEVGASITIPVR